MDSGDLMRGREVRSMVQLTSAPSYPLVGTRVKPSWEDNRLRVLDSREGIITDASQSRYPALSSGLRGGNEAVASSHYDGSHYDGAPNGCVKSVARLAFSELPLRASIANRWLASAPVCDAPMRARRAYMSGALQ